MAAEPAAMAEPTSRVGSGWRFPSPDSPCYQMDTQTQKRQKTHFVERPSESWYRLRNHPENQSTPRMNQTTHSWHSIGRWMKAQGKVKRRAHRASSIEIHVDARQRCRARDVESPATLPAMSTRNAPAGRWRNCLGKGRRRAHMFRFVRIHVGVGQRCRAIDVESPALQAKKRSA